jgi:hypothetical protein
LGSRILSGRESDTQPRAAERTSRLVEILYEQGDGISCGFVGEVY